MKKNTTLCVGILLSLLAMVLSACAQQVNAISQPTATALITAADQATATLIVEVSPTVKPTPVKQTDLKQTYSDPFAYCAAVGTLDTPDASYTGPQITDEIINGYKTAAGLGSSTEPMEMFRKTTIWRCMDKQVYVCNFGANLPCDSKADTNKTPTQDMNDYCKANPDTNFIPASVTGHTTIYSWHCVKDTAELLDQIEKVDTAGYWAQIWYAITPASNPKVTPSAIPTPLGGSSQIVFSSNRGGYYDDLYLLDLTGIQVTRLTSGDSNTFAGPFSPDGSQILFTGFGLVHSYVGVMNADGTHPVNLTNAEVDEGFPAWSPDGKQIVFTSLRDGNNEIYVINADGSQSKRLTNNLGDDFAPAWSPDGSQIVFVSDRDNKTGIYSIYLMNADGSHLKRLTNDKGSDYTPAWSPDGKQIAFSSRLNGSSDIYVIHVDGSGLTNLTQSKADNWSPAWSPDGKLIAFQTNRDGNWEIYLMNADGSSPRNLSNNPADDQLPYWR